MKKQEQMNRQRKKGKGCDSKFMFGYGACRCSWESPRGVSHKLCGTGQLGQRLAQAPKKHADMLLPGCTSSGTWRVSVPQRNFKERSSYGVCALD